MKDHSLIGKLIGFWPNEQALRDRIEAKWKTKAHYNLQLGSKVFFTIIFHHLEDKARVEDGGPYFFNVACLYLRNWVEIFYPEKEDLSWDMIWIRMYSLPQEYWDETILQEISNTLGNFIQTID